MEPPVSQKVKRVIHSVNPSQLGLPPTLLEFCDSYFLAFFGAWVVSKKLSFYILSRLLFLFCHTYIFLTSVFALHSFFLTMVIPSAEFLVVNQVFVYLKIPACSPHSWTQLRGCGVPDLQPCLRPCEASPQSARCSCLTQRHCCCVPVLCRWSAFSPFVIFSLPRYSATSVEKYLYVGLYTAVFILEDVFLFSARKFSPLNISSILCWSFSFYPIFSPF